MSYTHKEIRHILLNVLLIIDMLRYVWHIFWQNKDFVIYAIFVLVYLLNIEFDLICLEHYNPIITTIDNSLLMNNISFFYNYTENREKKHCTTKYFNYYLGINRICCWCKLYIFKKNLAHIVNLSNYFIRGIRN